MSDYLDFNFSTAEEIAAVLAQRLKQLRVMQNIAQADMAQRIGISRSTLNTFENTGKASLTTWIRMVQCLGQEAQLQPLFKPVVRSIADMERQQEKPRQRVTRTRVRTQASP